MSEIAPHALLQLMRLASPSLPVGGFSYSEGMEAAVDAGLVGNEHDAREWLLDQLLASLVRSDLAVVALAFDAWVARDVDELEALNQWVAMSRETRELRQQSEQTGRSLAVWLRHREHVDDRLGVLESLAPAPTWPLAFALAAVQAGASAETALLTCAAGWSENMVQAAMRSVPLGQIAAQRIHDALAEAIPGACASARGIERGDLQAFAPMLAILSSRHETQYSRLFRS